MQENQFGSHRTVHIPEVPQGSSMGWTAGGRNGMLSDIVIEVGIRLYLVTCIFDSRTILYSRIQEMTERDRTMKRKTDPVNDFPEYT
jgi:hypothetical protein